MPYHWLLIDPDNPNAENRARKVKKNAREKGAKVVFVGYEAGDPGTWYALVDIPEGRADDVFSAIGGKETKHVFAEGFEADPADEA